MEFIEVLKKRRSVRKYKDQPVARELMVKVIEAANMAPSATNSQPWSFTVLEKEDLTALTTITEQSFNERFGQMGKKVVEEKLAKLSIPEPDKFKGLSNFYRSLGGAPVAIIVTASIADDPHATKMNLASASAAVQNILLAACDLGLAACWMMGPLHKKLNEIKELLRIPPGEDIIAIIPLGYPAAEPESPKKVSAEEKTRWGL